jgi:hypothetical protein
MECKSNTLDGYETFDLFDVEFHTLKKNIRKEVVKVLKPFLEFLKAFDSHQIHLMLALMLDSCFKSLSVVESFARCGNVICIDIV